MTKPYYSWQSAEGDRVDHAVLQLKADGMRAVGTATAADYVLAWSLDASDGWVTRGLRVQVESFGWSRSLILQRHASGAWSSTVSATGSPDLPAAGMVDADALAGALDCDLGLCPVTNTMPIRRLELLASAVPPTPLVMAWVEVPSLRVIRSDQVYASSVEAGRVSYRSYSRDFHAELSVDDDGVVLDYPNLARRIMNE